MSWREDPAFAGRLSGLSREQRNADQNGGNGNISGFLRAGQKRR